jgi:two-component system nitrogen regulation sensor histidine kinase NtrY
MIWLLMASLGLTLALGLLLAFRIWRLINSRAAPETGARLHLRFAVLFSLAAVAPAVIVAAFLGATLSRGVEQWFSERVRTVVENAAGVARAYVTEANENTRGEIIAMAMDLNRAAAALQSDPAGYQRYLTNQAILREFPAAYVVSSQGVVLARAESEGAPAYQPLSGAVFAEAASQPVILLFEGDAVLRGVYRLEGYADAYLVILRELDPKLLEQLRLSADSVAAYRETEAGRARLQTLFVLSYVATVALVLLGAVWIGLSNATRIARPIGRLADAAGRVAAGDMAVRVPVARERDEVDALARAFNRMTAQLQAQRADLVNARQTAESRSRFTQAVLSGVSAGVLAIDSEGRIRVANRSAERLLGVAGGALDGVKLDAVSPELATLLDGETHLPAGQGVRIDLIRDAGTTHLSVRKALDAEAGGVILTFDDVTKLIAAQRHEAWKDVARRIAHEIKNPLTPIQLSAERLQRKYANEILSDRETFQRCTETILRQVGDIDRMVDEFSAFARMPAPRYDLADLVSLARETAFAQRLVFPDVNFEVDAETDRLEAWCDERLVGQALINLMKNAGEAIQARRARDGEPKLGHVQVRLETSADLVQISIIDNGLGMPAQNRDQLLEPYVTTRAKGAGLGLAIVRRIVEDHGGILSLADAPSPGPGAMVRISLPKHPTKIAAPAADNQENA